MIDSNPRILPPSLDGRQQTNRSLGYFVNELQLGSILQGSVSSIMQNGNALVSTIYGKFSIENLFGLSKGDRISFTISTDGENLFGTIALINDIANKSTESVALQIISKNSLDNIPITENAPIKIDINNQTPIHVPQNIKAKVSYLNLSNIDKNSIMYQILSGSSDMSSISFKIIKDGNSNTLLPHQLVGEVIEDNNDKSKQLVKTNFGILSVNNANINFGKKLILEIQSVDNTSIYNKLNMLSIGDFLFKLNDNWSALKQLLDSFIRFRAKNNGIVEDSKDISNSKELLKKLLDNPINKQEIRILSENLNKLKELYMMPYINHDEEHSWYSFFIPIFDGDKVINNKVYTQRTKNQILRFIIEINLEKFGEIQIDGYVKLNSNKIPESLDLIIRFKAFLNQELQGEICEMFTLYQNLSGIRGVLNFQQVQDFVDFSKT
jgi:hypothetical protein